MDVEDNFTRIARVAVHCSRHTAPAINPFVLYLFLRQMRLFSGDVDHLVQQGPVHNGQ
jgi:hypothetical protein